MEYRMTLFVMPDDINDFMESVDMKRKDKVFVIPHPVTFTYKGEINAGFFENIIDGSFDKNLNPKGFKIPAIEFCGRIYFRNGIKEISDGKNVYVVGKK